MANDPLVDQLIFRIAAVAHQVARIEDLVTHLEAGGLRADRPDHARRIPAENALVTSVEWRGASANLRVDGVHRDGPNCDQNVTPGRNGSWQFDLDKGFVPVNRAGLAIGYGAHGSCSFY
ncbi:hypothetical protein QE379_002427 [Sphingomonas sp. SORGH_AS 879]|nr:hypothetical protein [Sphingomonas sp. SORGH_AS_0879]